MAFANDQLFVKNISTQMISISFTCFSRKRQTLEETAAPCIFLELPGYLFEKEIIQQTSQADKCAALDEQVFHTFVLKDKIKS